MGRVGRYQWGLQIHLHIHRHHCHPILPVGDGRTTSIPIHSASRQIHSLTFSWQTPNVVDSPTDPRHGVDYHPYDNLREHSHPISHH